MYQQQGVEEMIQSIYGHGDRVVLMMVEWLLKMSRLLSFVQYN